MEPMEGAACLFPMQGHAVRVKSGFHCLLVGPVGGPSSLWQAEEPGDAVGSGAEGQGTAGETDGWVRANNRDAKGEGGRGEHGLTRGARASIARAGQYTFIFHLFFCRKT